MPTAILGVFIAIAAAALIAGLWLAAHTRRLTRNAERLVPAVGSFANINGQRIHFIDRGEGAPIVMIHGLGGTLHHMRRPLMDSFGPGYRLIALDRPGSGYSRRAASADGNLADQARLVVDFIDQLGLDRPLLVGHSLGGAVALAVALDHPEKISGLALLSPLTHSEADLPEKFKPLAIRSPLLRRILSLTIALPISVRNSPQTMEFVFGPQKPPVDFAVEGGSLAGLKPSHFYAASTDFVALETSLPLQESRYGEIRLPVGVLFGTEDRVLDYQRQGLELAREIEGLDIEILEGIGHMPQYAATEKVVAFIRRIAQRAFAG